MCLYVITGGVFKDIHSPGSKLYKLWPTIVATGIWYVMMQDGYNNKVCFGLLPRSSSCSR